MPKKNAWIFIVIPLGLLCLNVIYKILFLDGRDISIDEPFTLFYSQMPVSSIFNMLDGENNPPLFFLLMHGWIKLFGIEPFQARFLAFIFGVLSSVIIYFIGIRHFNFEVGISAALLFTFSNFNTYITQEARVYSLFVFLTLCSVYLFLVLLKKKKNSLIVILSLVNILLIYSHFFGFWVLVIEYIFILAIPDLRRRLLKPFLLMALFLLIAYLPYLMIFIKRFIESSGGTWLEGPTLSSFYNLLWKFCNQPVPSVIVISILLTGLFTFLFLYFQKKEMIDRSTLFLVYWFLIPTLSVFLISFFLPLFYEKYLVFISPSIYLLVACSVCYLCKNRLLRWSVLIVLIAVFLISSTPRPYYSKSVSALANDLKSIRSTSNPVFITPGHFDKTLIYHYHRGWFSNFDLFPETLAKNNFISVYAPEEIDPESLNQFSKVFLIEAGSQYIDPSGSIISQIQQVFDSTQVIKYDEVIKLYIFRKQSEQTLKRIH